MAKPIVAIVGRPNVGKSLLFNKLIGQRLSIVEDTPGVTRDRIYGETDWNGRRFTLVDTGGIEPNTDSQILNVMREQAQIAIDNATVIIFLCDIKTGLTASDQEVANMLLRSGKPIVLGVNKMDSTGALNPDIYEFMTGIKYLNFIADIFKVDADTRQERIRKYADIFEITDDLGQPIAAYSHGMKQKLAIICAWLHNPKLIIMDEPFVGLDPKASHLLKEMMREFCDNGGAIFFSTHVLEVAEKLCDKVAIIKGGRLIKSGTMEEVKGDDSLEDVFLELEDE